MAITDPYSLTLPEEPFDALTRTFKLAELKAYNEKFSALHEDAVALLRQALRISGKLRTESVWDEEDPGKSPISWFAF